MQNTLLFCVVLKTQTNIRTPCKEPSTARTKHPLVSTGLRIYKCLVCDYMMVGVLWILCASFGEARWYLLHTHKQTRINTNGTELPLYRTNARLAASLKSNICSSHRPRARRFFVLMLDEKPRWKRGFQLVWCWVVVFVVVLVDDVYLSLACARGQNAFVGCSNHRAVFYIRCRVECSKSHTLRRHTTSGRLQRKAWIKSLLVYAWTGKSADWWGRRRKHVLLNVISFEKIWLWFNAFKKRLMVS